MTESEAVKSIVSNAAPVVLKYISGSFGGKIISFADNVSEEEITGLLRKRNNNYVVREIVSQSSLTNGGPGSRLDNAT